MDAVVEEKREIGISESAAKRVRELQQADGEDGQLLRVSVAAGGCSGFQYSFSLDNEVNEDDHIFEGHGIKVVVDDASLDLLAGSIVDFKVDLIGSYFLMENPNAESTCGCGSSFAV